MKPAEKLAAAGYRKVPSIKNDPRLVPYWQRWEGSKHELDWFEFPHDLPVKFVWQVIDQCRRETLSEAVHASRSH